MSPSIVYFSIIVAFLASLTIFFTGPKVHYLRLFPFFIAYSGIVQVIGVFLSNRNISNTVLYNFVVPSELLFYLYTLFLMVENRLAKRIIVYAIFVFIGLVILNLLFLQKLHMFNSMSYAVGALLTVAICIYYFFELFQVSQPVNVARLPSFWLCAGLLFFYALTFPLLGLLNFLGSAPHVIINNFAAILNLLNVFLYSSFTIAFLCRIRVRSSMS